MPQYLNLRIPDPTGDRLKPHAAALGWSPNYFAERCIATLCDMIEDPGKRTLPDIVAMLDARRAASRQPLPGAQTPSTQKTPKRPPATSHANARSRKR
jgi:hypothetical protein